MTGSKVELNFLGRVSVVRLASIGGPTRALPSRNHGLGWVIRPSMRTRFASICSRYTWRPSGK